MEIRRLTEDYAVSPQIAPEDAVAIRAAGFVAVICNRPDPEIPPDLHAARVRAAVEAAGMAFIDNPVISGGMTADNIDRQAEAMAAAGGPVFAYCASGNRCSVVWAFANAGRRPTDELIAIPARFGYRLDPLRDQIEAFARRG
jgi:uncharacterized protein (TIGR01244 family)